MHSVAQLKAKLKDEVDSIRNRIIDIAKYIYDNPEIGYEEYKASALLTAELEKSGCKVTKGLAGLPTAFKAVMKGKMERPMVAILAEYDALPGLGHACGHNISAASAIGAAIALSKLMPELSGTLIIFGTPAEEGVVENAGEKW